MSYHSAWSIRFPITQTRYAWLTTFIDVVNECVGEDDTAILDQLKAYPTFDIADSRMYDILSYELVADTVVIYNDECEGGFDQAAGIVQAYIRHFDLPLRVGFILSSVDGNKAWGGAVHITKHEIKRRSLDVVLDEMEKTNEIDWRAENNSQIST